MYDRKKREPDDRSSARRCEITWLAQAGAYTLMQRLNELPQDKTINIMLSLTLWAFGLVGLWFDFLVPEPIAPEADKEKAGKGPENGHLRWAWRERPLFW